MYMTRRQREVLDCIESFIQDNGYSPTLEEIGERLGLSSLATVHKHLQNLEAKGLLKRNWNHSRAIELTQPLEADPQPQKDVVALPLLGEVAAGLPIEAIQSPETVDVPSNMVGRRDSYVLRVRGQSMIEDGIFDGDLIVVESANTAQAGQTVVALINGSDATVKRFRQRGKTVTLIPANETMQPMEFPADQVQIQGHVIGLMRQY